MSGWITGRLAATSTARSRRPSADVDIDAGRSNQHEFNGTLPLRSLFGDDDIRDIRTTFAYMCDEAEPEMCDGTVTWYDARRKHPTRTEYRLYYKDNPAIRQASAGDLMVVANSDDLGLLIIFAKKGSTIESQLRWLFGFEEPDRSGYAVSKGERNRIGAVASRILGIDWYRDARSLERGYLLGRYGQEVWTYVSEGHRLYGVLHLNP